MQTIASAQKESESGFTLFELIVTMVLTSIVFIGAMQAYNAMTAASYDLHIRIETNVQAQAIIQTIGNELRVLGNGVPFEQPNFQIGENTLSDPVVTEPILVNEATTSSIQFRLNETGEVALLMADFNPSLGLTVQLTDVAGLDANDPVYITNSVMSGDDGLYATITHVDTATNSITIDPAYVASPGAFFPMGSVLEEVPIVTYAYTPDVGITRDSGYGPVLLGNNAKLSFDYLDHNGNSLVLPLTNELVVNSLRSIRVTVKMANDSLLKNGEEYIATVSQVFGLRNLNYLY